MASTSNGAATSSSKAAAGPGPHISKASEPNHTQPKANEIGWMFVPQYYTFVNKDPGRLHCFYTKRSTLIHGTEGEDTQPCYGQQEIHNKIMSLGFDDCKVFVSNVDSQSSAEGGIIVQVIGELSNKNGPWKKFAQTFFLAEQPNGYFVLNDIFRYIKEENAEEEPEEEAPAVPITAEIEAKDVHGHPADAAPVTVPDPAVASQPVPEEPTYVAPAPPTEEPVPTRPQVNGIHHEPAAPQPAPVPETTAEPVEEPIQTAPEPAETSSIAVPPTADPSSAFPSAPSTQEPTEPPAPTPAPKPEAPSPAPQPPKQAEQAPPAAPAPPAENVKKSWSALAASNPSRWGSAMADSKGVSSAAPPPLSAPSQAPAPERSEVQQPQPTSAARTPVNVGAISSAATFVKGVVETISDEQLESALQRFGTLKSCDIIRNKACAFVDFNRVEDARKAIQASLPRHLGGEGGIVVGEDGRTIHVEEKKEKGSAGRPAKTGADDRSRGGFRNVSGPGGQQARTGEDVSQRGGGRGGRSGGGGGGRGGNVNRGGRGGAAPAAK